VGGGRDVLVVVVEGGRWGLGRVGGCGESGEGVGGGRVQGWWVGLFRVGRVNWGGRVVLWVGWSGLAWCLRTSGFLSF